MLKNILNVVRNHTVLVRKEIVHKYLLPSMVHQQVRHYDDFDTEFEQMKTQQVPDQEIPPAKDSTVYEIMNFKVQGYDCTLVEHFAQYAHNLAKNMELNIFESYAMPTKSTLIHTIQKPGTPEKEKVRDFTLHTHERVIQIQDLPSTTAPLFTEMLQLNLPEGVQMKIEPHTQEHFKERYIRKEIPDSLL
ncbi:39S ribosomal protein L48, mitochondrial-like [Lytechinus variegatus]|uniref:39S ribosomal protein L48, mitochondrial-like n=1 Tax=Lytechinus variegatus TaxID=7654 RepID=UPI001BB0E7EF|nr:39S ribosomal protein L48, mitochondrial-like [Lytechinus variegatus]